MNPRRKSRLSVVLFVLLGVAVASAAGTVDFTVPQKDGGEAQNRTENLVALSHDDLTKVIPTGRI